MDILSHSERELVALGAALASNCVPCIQYHIPEARKAGLSERQIGEALRLADKVRQVPARKVLDAAAALLPESAASVHADGGGQPCCGSGRPQQPGAQAG